jgi:hypothetical protein
MNLLALLLAAQAVPASAAPAPVPPLILLQAFRTYCHERRGDRQAAALAAGFGPMPIASAGDTGGETAAWEKDGIRLFEMSGRADRYLLAPAACGVSANIGAAGDQDALEALFFAEPDYVWMQVTRHDRRIYWNLILRNAGLVRVAFDRTRPTAVRMSLTGTGEPPQQSGTR